MSRTLKFASLVAIAFVCCSLSDAIAADPPGALEVLPGYKHVPLQGIDSVVGKITHTDGREIFYEIGHVHKPGEPRFGGSFSDRAVWLMKNKKDDLQWSASREVNGEPMNIALLKDGKLTASFPKTGANFSMTTKTPADLADALLMILSYPRGK